MGAYVIRFNEIDSKSWPDVGGKGANLGELSKAGFNVPQGFCVTTSAYRCIIGASSEMGEWLELLDRLQPDQLDEICALGKQMREHMQSLAIPENIKGDIIAAWEMFGEEHAYAVRSSATAEDLPTASFAGQQETYLNIRGPEQLLEAVQKCWASLFTDRAIVYRVHNGFGHSAVSLSVVVQQMVFPDVSGIMFTADPVTGHRQTVSIDAGFGLGEAMVSGIVSADLYQVRNGQIVRKQIAAKEKAVYPAHGGGTEVTDLLPAMRRKQTLSDNAILELAGLGQRIEKHYGLEQDIEWCLAGDRFFILQSRPITSLYPVPPLDKDRLHVFVSIGHLQMMMDAMKPLTTSLWFALFPFGKKSPGSRNSILLEAGGRLFYDVTFFLYWKTTRRYIAWNMKLMDELMGDALSKLAENEALLRELRVNRITVWQILKLYAPILPLYIKFIPGIIKNIFRRNTDCGIEQAMVYLEEDIDQCKRSICGVTGAQRIKNMQKNAGGLMFLLKGALSCVSLGLICLPIAGKLSKRWLGEKLDVITLNKSLPGNVTSELGLMIGDLADTARKYPEVADYLERAEDNSFYQGLGKVTGGAIFEAEWVRVMERYGMRCPGEIDISNQRWRESPTMLVPSILNHMKTNTANEHRERFRQGQQEADEAVQNLLARLRKTFGGSFKVKVMARLLSLYRNTAGLREFPKYAMIRIFDVYRQAILEEAKFLCKKGILPKDEYVFYLSLDELAALLENRFSGDVGELIHRRRKAYQHYQKLTPPRVMTSEGEIFTGARSGVQAPEGSLVGTPVSAGVVEGYVKIVLRPEGARLNKGDILVAPFTDPGWTPLFYSAKALVVEVGGLMTHGSVVAREYGIPAVVGVDNVTKQLKEGQYVRVDGTKGFVQVLEQKS